MKHLMIKGMFVVLPVLMGIVAHADSQLSCETEARFIELDLNGNNEIVQAAYYIKGIGSPTAGPANVMEVTEFKHRDFPFTLVDFTGTDKAYPSASFKIHVGNTRAIDGQMNYLGDASKLVNGKPVSTSEVKCILYGEDASTEGGEKE